MRDEITALRGLVGSGEGTDAEVKVHAAELVHELAEVSKERDDLRAQWDELKGLYRDKVTDEFGSKDIDLGQVIEEHHLQANELELYETMLTEAVGELNQLRKNNTRGASNREALEGHLEDVEQAHHEQFSEHQELKVRAAEQEKKLNTVQRELKNITRKFHDTEEQLEKKSSLASSLKRETQALSRRVSDHKALLTELDTNHQKAISKSIELASKLAEETAAKESAQMRADELAHEKEEHERHYLDSIEAFEAAAQSAAGEMRGEHERIKLHLEELLTQSSDGEQQAAERQAELLASQSDFADAQDAIDAACQQLRDAIISRDSAGQAPWEPNALATELVGLDLPQLISRFVLKKLAPTVSPAYDDAEIADLRTRLADREALLARVMQYMADNKVDVEEDGKEGAQGAKSGLSTILGEYDEDIQQLLLENDRLIGLNARLRGDVARLSAARGPSDVEVAEDRPVRAKVVTSVGGGDGGEPYDLSPESGAKLDSLGFGDLMKELGDSESDRTALVKLVEELLARVAELEQRIIDLGDLNVARDTKIKELSWCEGEYKLANQNITKLMALQKQDSVLRSTLEATNGDLRQTNLELTQKIVATSSAEGNADTAASYPELLSQLERLQKDYDDVISRLRKLMDWTKLQARRTWQNDSAAVHCNGCDKQFTFLLRRHHCRICGKVYCRFCTCCRVQTTLQKKPVRSCTPCYEYVSKTVFDNDSTGCIELRVVIERGAAMMPLDFIFTSSTNEKYGGTEVLIDAVESTARHSVCTADDSVVEEKLMAGDRVLCVNGVNVSSVPADEVSALFECGVIKIDIERPPDPTLKLEAATNRMEELMAIDRAQRARSISASPNDPDYDAASDDYDDYEMPGVNHVHHQNHAMTSDADLQAPENWVPLSSSPKKEPDVFSEEESSYIDIAPDVDESADRSLVLERTIMPADVGRRVSVTGYPCSGYLRFVGAHKETGEIRCGVELDRPVANNDGSVNGHEYFSCGPKHGVLCSPAKVSFIYMESGL
eukprot:m.253964 g.253964  ORF g.253964 m.253964 type:complete len:1014 (-) comp26534_c1_seq1:6980-10021(-)